MPVTTEDPAYPAYRPHGRRTRIGLLALLVLAALFSGGALFLKYQLESLRELVQNRIESRVGARLKVESIQVYGVRGLRIDAFEGLLGGGGAPHIKVAIPHVYIHIDPIDLLYGNLVVQRVEVDHAHITLERPLDSHWFGGGTKSFNSLPFNEGLSFRILGKNCHLNIYNLVGPAALEIGNLNFDLVKLVDSEDFSAKISGLIGNRPGKDFSARLRYASLEDFEFRAHAEALAPEDINPYLPEEQRFLRAGEATPTLRLSGYPNHTLILGLEMNYAQLALKNQPPLLHPLTGNLALLAYYDTAHHSLSITTAQLDSSQLAGAVEGDISFATPNPHFNLRFQAHQVPLKEALDYALPNQQWEAGELSVEIGEEFQLAALLQGDLANPSFSAEFNTKEGAVHFLPADKNFPAATLSIGLVNLRWENGAHYPQGVINITSGNIDHPLLGATIQDLSGTLSLTDAGIQLSPLHASVTGNAFVGEALIDPQKPEATFSVNGTLSNIQNLPLGNDIPKVALAGSANCQCKGVLRPDHYMLDLALDITQTQFDYEWWFSKPQGIGASIRGLNIDMIPGKTLRISGNAALDTTQINAILNYRYRLNKWDLETATAKTDIIDVLSAGKCIRIPYTADGNIGKEGYYTWKDIPGREKAAIVDIGGHFDQIAFLPEDCDAPISCQEATVKVTLDDSLKDDLRATLEVQAKEAAIPSLGKKWLLPLHPETADFYATYPERPRTWVMHFAADKLAMPPWEGANFRCSVEDNDAHTWLKEYSASIGEGRLTGSYRFEKEENLGKLNAEWQNIPAIYLLRHLKFPELLDGEMTGEVEYSVDQDDPGTLRGHGFFDIRNGLFSADVILDQFAGQLSGDIALPPSLQFKRFFADVLFEGDSVNTSDIILEGNGIGVTGSGQYIIDGDMDYQLRLVISPETAAQMPMLCAYFNIDGHRLTQNNIELTFNIHGPTFSPSGQVAGLPSVGVTLVSGAAEVTKDAIKVIDLPRQILVDLVKIGGGIVGAGK